MSAPLPRVTWILRRAGLVDPTWFKEEARLRGQALHLAARYLDEGSLEWDSVDAAILARLRQYQSFLDEVQPDTLSIEEEVENRPYGYVGHLDRRVKIGGREGVLDLKSPNSAPWHGLQVAMYAACFARPLRRWTLHLGDDRYRLVEHTDRRDWEVAKAAIVLAAWKEQHHVE